MDTPIPSAPIPSVPVLTTPRLTLRGHGPADLADMAAMHADPAFYRLLAGKPTPREDVWHRLLRYVGHWQVAGYGHWVVRETASGRYLGDVGLMDSRRATDPGFEGVPEVGWGFAGHAHGRGFAAEALGALFGWADARIARTVCIIDPANAASLRLAGRLGFVRYADGTYRDQPTVFLERRRP